MSHQNQYPAFGVGPGANTISNSSFMAVRSGDLVATGFLSGLAKSEEFNTILRICSVGVSALAQFAADFGTQDMLDDGSVTNFKTGLKSALDALYTPIVPTAIILYPASPPYYALRIGSLYIMWGTGQDGGAVTNPFPMAFPNACLSIQLTHTAAAGGLVEAPIVRAVTTTNYVAANVNGATMNHYFLAIGY